MKINIVDDTNMTKVSIGQRESSTYPIMITSNLVSHDKDEIYISLSILEAKAVIDALILLVNAQEQV